MLWSRLATCITSTLNLVIWKTKVAKFLFGQSFQSESFLCGFSAPYQLSEISEIPDNVYLLGYSPEFKGVSSG